MAFDGERCVTLSGCACEGASCSLLYESPEACDVATASCDSRACGGATGLTCAASDYCDFEDETCGASGAAGVCRTRPETCPFVLDRICACDERTYDNECFAQREGTDVFARRPCEGCAAMDAEGAGDCIQFFGWKWTGRACVGVGGCECSGRDCRSLFASQEACEETFLDC
ncbi:MAG: hypothetical protein AAGH15_07025 [Myxococcota bacterium]